ncbi:hypothetical protein [Corynebacterium singulare]|uniref:hypothetical protein n=1 Tax=Corynebacterium singulare TaxID=161899 RepID=UPI00119F1879|nr:hypothetical protein [Corynebacterium singulare]
MARRWRREGTVDVELLEHEVRLGHRIESAIRSVLLNRAGVYVANWENDVNEELGYGGIVFRELWRISDEAFERAVLAFAGSRAVKSTYRLRSDEAGRYATMEVLQQ